MAAPTSAAAERDRIARARARSWPDLDPSRVVFEDEALLAVDKPEGVACQAADPDHPDDLVHRLRRFLEARDGAPPTLGVLQRLEPEVSGVVVYTLDKRANRGLAAQLEGRTAKMRYVAVVAGWRGTDRQLTHHLARGPDGATHVVDARDRRGKRSVQSVRVLARREGRAMLEIEGTGGAHPIRAQLAAEGAPIVGDRLYGGAPAPRLMLHLAGLTLDHPVGGGEIQPSAPVPVALERALAGGPDPLSDEALDASIARAMERRWGLAHRAEERAPTSAFRLLNEGGDGVAGLAIDVYDDWLVVHTYESAVEARLEAILDRLERYGFAGVYLKRRPKQANVIVDGRDESYAPSAPVRGRAAPEPLVVTEHGVPYRVRLGEGLSTGIFLDQRDNRARVRELARDARVLNLFAYTCPFTVAAAAGGAAETLSVDFSARLLAWGEENLAGAGLAGPQHAFLAADCFDALEDLATEGRTFDLVCLDPPTYSKTKASRWTSGKDWQRLAALALSVLAPGGKLLACSNDRRLRRSQLRRHVHEASRRASVRLAQLKDLPCPADFPPPLGEEPHLKSLLCTREG